MDDIKISRIYANAIFDIAKEKNEIFEVLEMLDLLVKHVNDDEDFKKFLDYPIIENKDKKKLIDIIYKDMNVNNLDIINYLIEKDRLSHVEGIRDEYLKIYYELHKQLIVTAIFPQELTKEQEEKLVKKLEKLKGKKILLHKKIDETLIAGGIIKIDDEVIDGSLKTQINELKKRF
ncbi:ATP synthase F1 subunit delta [Oceanivirga salmonicida]|uniref:ATP synthase F1 subunit delta n=1 Tax=Oceanivirga salmonicida TaxID=1769291 RepID=UPI0012E168AC|nr:ATP synthase F1 subunit delta [Oceanivirga salmonicida]